MQQIRDDATKGVTTLGLHGYTYFIRTFGCQMNKADSERIAGMLDVAGMQMVGTPEEADVVIFMTCCVREAADIRLLGQAASLKGAPRPHGRRIIAIGGCMGQRDGAKLVDELGDVDIVFGTQNIEHLPSLLVEALESERPRVEILERSEGFVTDLPVTREQPWHAWVPITSGCNNFCTYCIVPYVRGRERSRPIEDILSELHRLEQEGIKEVTFLGQNVNSYGRDLYGAPRFAKLLQEAGETSIPRIRFATSHPKDLLDETIDALGQSGNIMPSLHLPIQSGSDRILSAMNRHYTARHYLDLIDKVRDRVPDIALSTDIIVGFPGETEEDFQATCDVCRRVGYSQAFTFIYSRREGTPAAEMFDDTPREVIQRRFDELVEIVQDSAWKANQRDAGTVVPVLIEGVSKRDETLIVGHSPKNQVVHAPIPKGRTIDDLVGRIEDVHIDLARTWYLRGTLVDIP